MHSLGLCSCAAQAAAAPSSPPAEAAPPAKQPMGGTYTEEKAARLARAREARSRNVAARRVEREAAEAARIAARDAAVAALPPCPARHEGPVPCKTCRKRFPALCAKCVAAGVSYTEATLARALPPLAAVPPPAAAPIEHPAPAAPAPAGDLRAVFGAMLPRDERPADLAPAPSASATSKPSKAAVIAAAAVAAALGASPLAPAAAPPPPPAIPHVNYAAPPTITVEQLRDRAALRLARHKLSWFVQLAFARVLKPGTQLAWDWYLDAICDHLQAMFEDWLIAKGLEPPTLPGLRDRVTARWRAHKLEIQPGKALVQNLAINVAPGTLKSVIAMVCFPAWAWLHHPAFQWGCSSGAPANVTRDSDAHRDLVTSEWYRESFKVTWKVRDDIDSKEKWQTTAGGLRESRGMKARWTGTHVDALLLDDPDDAFAVFGEAARRDVQGQWRDAMENRINDPEFSFRVIVQQHVHTDDLTNHLLSLGLWSAADAVTRARWDKLEIGMEFIPERRHTTAYGWTDPRTEAGKCMHEARFSKEYLASKREKLGSYGYEAQYNQNAELLDGGMFERGWFNFFRLEGVEISPRPRPPLCKPRDPLAEGYVAPYIVSFKEGEPALDFLAVSVDATFGSTKATASNVGLLAVGGLGNRRFVFDDQTKKRNFPDTKRAVIEMLVKWRPARVLIEHKANGQAVIDELRDAIAEAKIVGLDGKPIVCVFEAIEPKNDGGGKVARAMMTQGIVEAGHVHILDGASWADDFIGEMCAFPNGKRDDRVDALTQALNFYRGALSAIQRWEAMSK